MHFTLDMSLGRITLSNWFFLANRYPGLGKFIYSCHIHNEYDKLADFLIAIEDQHVRYWH